MLMVHIADILVKLKRDCYNALRSCHNTGLKYSVTKNDELLQSNYRQGKF